METAFAKSSTAPTPHRWVTWKMPPLDWIALNVDGSSLGNPGNAGFGGLLRDSNGAWISGFLGAIGITNNLHAELMGLLHGLQLTWENGYRKFICYSDSMDALSLINRFLPVHHHYSPVVLSIQDLLQRDWEVVLKHTLREGNFCADLLAKMGANSSSNLTIIHVAPPGISPLLLADAMV
ncbi:hypothetical protein OROGR_030849 [Orobanche gracilis]